MKEQNQHTMVTEEIIQNAKQLLKNPPPLDRKFTVSEALIKLKPELQKLRRDGYSLSLISEMLKKSGIKASPSLLSQILGPLKKSRVIVEQQQAKLEKKTEKQTKPLESSTSTPSAQSKNMFASTNKIGLTDRPTARTI